jgi:hypothetical protein
MQRVIIETEAFIIYFLFSFMVFKAKESLTLARQLKRAIQ